MGNPYYGGILLFLIKKNYKSYQVETLYYLLRDQTGFATKFQTDRFSTFDENREENKKITPN